MIQRERIQQAATNILHYAIAALPLALGYLAGLCVRIVRIARAALVEGYHAGNKL